MNGLFLWILTNYFLHFIEQIITIFDLEAHWYLIASRQKGLKAQQEQEGIRLLRQALNSQPRLYPYSSELQEEEGREGPSLELRVRDVLGREWPVSCLSVVSLSVHIDSLSGACEEEKKCFVLTRQVWQSLDRFVALLIEHYEGMFPLWLFPEQVRVLAIGEANQAYARQVVDYLRNKGIRAKLDLRQSKLSLRVHEAEREKVPYLVLLGEQERMKQVISIRTMEKINQDRSIDIETFVNNIYQESLCPMPFSARIE
jgi:threonyl-tRNA synthetase